MIIVQILSLVFFTLVAPVTIGSGIASFVDKQRRNLAFMWMAGFLAIFCFFQLLAVPLILLKQNFMILFWAFLIIILVLCFSSFLLFYIHNKRVPYLREVKPVILKGNQNKLQAFLTELSMTEKVLWSIFGVLLLLQLILAVVLTFADGDDSYYVGISTIADQSGAMYTFIPYTGESTALDIRHCLAPFPLYVTFLAKVSGIHAAITSHIVMQLVLIPMTYCIYGLIGDRLFKGRKKYLAIFMMFISIIILWGNYSFYTAETFLMTRTRQGKAALGNIVIPALFLLLFMIGERMSENRKIEKSLWLLVFMTVTSACLCSVLGGFLVALLLGLYGFCIIIFYKKIKQFIPLVICVLPAIVYLALYVVLK